MIKITVDISNATESEIEELNKLIPFGREKFHFDKNNIKVEFFTKQDAEIVNANLSIGLRSDIKDFVNMSKKDCEILMSNVNTHFFMKVNDEEIKEVDTKSAQSMEGFPIYNRQGKSINMKPFVSENSQLEVIHIIDRGQSFEQMTKDINDKKFIADTKNYMNKIIKILEIIENIFDNGLSNRLNEDDIRNVCKALELDVNDETIEYITSRNSQQLERFITELVKNMRKQDK